MRGVGSVAHGVDHALHILHRRYVLASELAREALHIAYNPRKLFAVFGKPLIKLGDLIKKLVISVNIRRIAGYFNNTDVFVPESLGYLFESSVIFGHFAERYLKRYFMLSIFKIKIIRLAVFVTEVKNRPSRVIFKAYFPALLKRGAAVYFKPP